MNCASFRLPFNGNASSFELLDASLHLSFATNLAKREKSRPPQTFHMLGVNFYEGTKEVRRASAEHQSLAISHGMYYISTRGQLKLRFEVNFLRLYASPHTFEMDSGNRQSWYTLGHHPLTSAVIVVGNPGLYLLNVHDAST